MKNILITGGSGLIGSKLTQLLEQRGYAVAHLSRSPGKKITTYLWNTSTMEIDDRAVAWADAIIHLAGANVGAHRWTKKYKAEILKSRTDSTALLHNSLERTPNKVKVVVSASATGYYGHRGDAWLKEEDSPADDFLGNTCVQWEAAVNKLSAAGCRVVKLRTGIVLAQEGGALPPLVFPVRMFVAPIFGNGQQFYPWIHVDDLCRMYLYALENKNVQGSYNAVAPYPVRFSSLMDAMAKALGKRKINMPVPLFVLELVKGEFMKTLTFSTRCSAEKILSDGFKFEHEQVEEALKQLLGNNK